MNHPVSPTLETKSYDSREISCSDATNAYLLLIDGSSSRRYALPQDGVLVVGRSPDAAIRIESAAISRRHAKIIVVSGEVRIADLESHNGTIVNGERIEGSRALA